MSSTRSNTGSLNSSCRKITPAQLMRMSTRSSVAANAATSSACVTSSVATSTPAGGASADGSPTAITRAPSRASASATPRPSP
ncbi:hypothetical protein G6F46_015743 [Rhizopus delemar]|nr:hypothetical protein G6F46_015743 [Rhizopus delemar]